MKKLNQIVCLMAASIIALSASAQTGGLTGTLAPTPPMGWNSWNTFQTRIDEPLLKGMVDAMVSSGMRDAGYQYFTLDDGWMAMQRDANGNLVADPKKFPNGMKAFADYVHSKGLKFGLYNCAGTKTCAGYPGSRGHEYQDALLYASWGVDFLKYDWCNTDSLNAREAYITMSSALKATKRPILFSLCEWGSHQPWNWKGIGEMYRTTGDISAKFTRSVMRIADKQFAIRKFNGPNHWNDPDMLEVGNGMTVAEDRAHFSMWCMFAAPLVSGNDLRKMTDQTRAFLTNKDMIAIDQDERGISAFKMPLADSVELWVKPLKNNMLALCMLNRSAKAQKVSFKWADLSLSDELSGLDVKFAQSVYNLYDVWAAKKAGSTKGTFTQEIASHDVVVLRLEK